MVGILELLIARGLDVAARVKIVRHQDQRYDLVRLERDGLLELYQRYQGRPVFNCDYIVSCIGLENSHARLFGIYRVAGPPERGKPQPPVFSHPDTEAPESENYYYSLEAVPGFDDLNGRVVIHWGTSALAWHQWLVKPGTSNDKEVVEILPRGYVREFPGYLDFAISFDELAEIVRNPNANREWHRMLSAVAGVYLIVDSTTGKQYVGSASGENGIMGRWANYVATGHGGNVQMVALMAANAKCMHQFTFTVLRTLPRTLTKLEVIGYESLYKQKLGSRAFGLNS